MPQRSTLHDVAHLAGVSRSAVGRILLGTGGENVRVSPDTEKRIRRAAKQLNYTPNRLAQQLRGASSKTLGLIVETENIPVMSERLFAMEREASRQGYRLIIGRTHGQIEELKDYVSDFSGRGAEAIFCLFDLSPGRDDRLKEAFRTYKKVAFHGRPAWSGGYCVKADTTAAVRAAVDYLVGRGRRRIALALWNVPQDELMSVRKEAFFAALARHKIRPREKMVWDAASETVNPVPEVLDRGIETLAMHCKADAILASNDIWAVRFILRLKEIGMRVPEDVAIVGYDNLDIGGVISPSLTTIDQCHEGYAAAAIGLLLRLARNDRIPRAERTLTVTPHLVIRDSS